MKEKHFTELFTLRLKGDIAKSENEQLSRHLESCESCRQEFAEMEELWETMEVISAPEPSPMLKTRFDDMLANYQKSTGQKKSWKTYLTGLLHWRPKTSLAGQFALVFLGFAVGYLLFNPGKSDQAKEMTKLSEQAQSLKQNMMLTMLENPSASKRIRAVSFTDEIKNADKEVIEALLSTLNNDPNVNVRLGTLDALMQLAGKPEVRQGLVKSITRQNSPLMQLAIAETMLQLQEPASVKPLQQLLAQKELDEEVRDKIGETINRLL